MAISNRKGIGSIENLSNEQERSQFAVKNFNSPEKLRTATLPGYMEPAMWVGNEWQMGGHLMTPSTMQWWEERRHAFSQNFQEFIGNLTPDRERVSDTPVA